MQSDAAINESRQIVHVCSFCCWNDIDVGFSVIYAVGLATRSFFLTLQDPALHDNFGIIVG